MLCPLVMVKPLMTVFVSITDSVEKIKTLKLPPPSIIVSLESVTLKSLIELVSYQKYFHDKYQVQLILYHFH